MEICLEVLRSSARNEDDILMVCSSFKLIRPWVCCTYQLLYYLFKCRCSKQTFVCNALHTQPGRYNWKSVTCLATSLRPVTAYSITCFMPCQNIKICTLFIQRATSCYFLAQVAFQNHNPTHMKHKNNIPSQLFNIKFKGTLHSPATV